MGFFDPFGLTKAGCPLIRRHEKSFITLHSVPDFLSSLQDGDVEAFKRRRATELKNGAWTSCEVERGGERWREVERGGERWRLGERGGEDQFDVEGW